MTADNCSVNQAIGRRAGAVPMIGCASHGFNLVMKDYMSEDVDLLEKVHLVMKKLATIKGRALLSRVSKLNPVLKNETRWSSTYEMAQRYVVLHQVLCTLSRDDLEEHDVISLTKRDLRLLYALYNHLEHLHGATKELQSARLTPSGVWRIFDAVVKNTQK